eukprot:c9558_g1_i1.p1 GENE.c9558_g1_i1~~c9558_g1_i1.p1  ORF type:complete len:301 (-),score=81.34 c9558_g1_i1:28-930(-)
MAPTFAVFVIREYCFDDGWNIRSVITRATSLGFSSLFIFVIAFGPWMRSHNWSPVIERLFPFGRGLCHAYWAPNFWAIYNVLDIVAAFIAKKWFGIEGSNGHSMTRGLVGVSSHSMLPTVTPTISALLVLLTLIPILFRVARKSSKDSLSESLAASALGYFLFGWHIHEKHILMCTVPLSLVALQKPQFAGVCLMLHMIAAISMFPLLFHTKEFLVKVSLTAIQLFLYRLAFQNNNIQIRYVRILVFTSVLLALEVYREFIHSFVFGDRFEFLALMFTSVACAVGNVFLFGVFWKNLFWS